MDNEKLNIVRHSCAHLVAAAAQKLYPNAKFGVGPIVENGFYYDIDFPEPIGEGDLEKIEKEARRLIGQNLAFERIELDLDEAIKLFQEAKQDYKVSLLKDLKEKGTTKVNDLESGELSGSVDKVSLYKTGDFIDLCRGPHVESTKEIPADGFKLTKLAGAYWRGDSNNAQLQRIYGLCFADKQELKQYLFMLEEAEKRDHRKLGKELDLFSFHDEGPGFPFWHAKGTVVYDALKDFVRQENEKRGYGEVMTPVILNENLWKISGHWDNFKENMYFTEIDEQEYAVKPMNCPGGLLIYKSKPHSYKELPIKNAEFGYVHRHELSGVLSGLFRVRAFTQDDAHVFCSEDMLEKEIIDMVDYAQKVYGTFGFKDYDIYIATRPAKSIGADEVWETATNALRSALKNKGLEFKIKEGEGAFYGPKIEFNIKDAIRRNWQCGTIQVDFSMPSRFGAVYVDKDNQERTPVMVHRAILGSLERFLGILVEHYAGCFPVWMSPVQIALLPVSEKHAQGAEKIKEELVAAGLRVENDAADETIGNKVRKVAKQKIPYVVVIGDKELSGENWMIRLRGQKDQKAMSKEEFLAYVKDAVENKKEI